MIKKGDQNMTNGAIYIEGTRQGYAPDQVERNTMTVRELIDYLEELACENGDDTRVFIQNDNGYTFGAINYGTITVGDYDENEYDLGI